MPPAPAVRPLRAAAALAAGALAMTLVLWGAALSLGDATSPALGLALVVLGACAPFAGVTGAAVTAYAERRVAEAVVLPLAFVLGGTVVGMLALGRFMGAGVP